MLRWLLRSCFCFRCRRFCFYLPNGRPLGIYSGISHIFVCTDTDVVILFRLQIRDLDRPFSHDLIHSLGICKASLPGILHLISADLLGYRLPSDSEARFSCFQRSDGCFLRTDGKRLCGASGVVSLSGHTNCSKSGVDVVAVGHRVIRSLPQSGNCHRWMARLAIIRIMPT